MKLMSLLLVMFFSLSIAIAAPGAHGPNGEHLDGAATGPSLQSDLPRIETFTESFELVGTLNAGELSVLVDRYLTNEPVLNGKLEVQFDGIKTQATFHADQGDYSFDDANFLKAIAKPGSHALLFTLTAGGESDLLEATLLVKQAAGSNASAAREKDHDHSHELVEKLVWFAGALLALILGAVVFFRRRKHSPKV